MTQSSRCSEARLDGAICRSGNGNTSVPSGSGRMLCGGVSRSSLSPSLKQDCHLTDLEASFSLLKPEDVRVRGHGQEGCLSHCERDEQNVSCQEKFSLHTGWETSTCELADSCPENPASPAAASTGLNLSSAGTSTCCTHCLSLILELQQSDLN